MGTEAGCIALPDCDEGGVLCFKRGNNCETLTFSRSRLYSDILHRHPSRPTRHGLYTRILQRDAEHPAAREVAWVGDASLCSSFYHPATKRIPLEIAWPNPVGGTTRYTRSCIGMCSALLYLCTGVVITLALLAIFASFRAIFSAVIHIPRFPGALVDRLGGILQSVCSSIVS